MSFLKKKNPRIPSRMPYHLVVLSPWAPLGCDSFSDLACFDDLDIFEVDRSGILLTVSQLGFVWCSSH